MKEEILSIASDLREGFISSTAAKEQLLSLFGIGDSACPHKNTTYVFGIFGGEWCEDCKQFIKGRKSAQKQKKK